MPETLAKEKRDTLKQLGATIHLTPAVPYTDERNYQKQARAYAESHDGVFWTNQFDNLANRESHRSTTGVTLG